MKREEVRKRLDEILLKEDIQESIETNIDFLLEVIPEIKPMIGFDQKHPHHHLDVYNHTIEALRNSKKDLRIRMALLLHDIGKPFSYQDEKVRHFHGHPEVSARMTKSILERLGYGQQFIEDIYYLVKEHDTVIDVNHLDNTMELIKRRLEVQFADAKAHHPDKVQKRLNVLNTIKSEIEKIEKMER